MSTSRKSASDSVSRVAAYRERMRARGLRPIQLWVPDVRGDEYRARIDREIAIIAAGDPAGDDVLEWMPQLYDWPDEPDSDGVR